MFFLSGERVRLLKAAPQGTESGPPVGAVGTVVKLEIPATKTLSDFWCVDFDGFDGQFHRLCEPGFWYVDSEAIEPVLEMEPLTPRAAQALSRV